MSPRPRRPVALSLLALSLALGVPATALAEPASTPATAPATSRFDGVRAAIAQVMEQAEIPSIAVAVVQDGEIIWEDAFGWADRERQVPATIHTPYSIASMTKPITATAVMTLSQAGQLDLDAPIERYLGGLRLTGHAGSTEQVTARRIMSHSAGLPQYGNFYLDGAPPAASRDTIARFGMVVFLPDSRFEYSNIGMTILDAAIEQVSGLGYGDYLQRAVFAPLGMTHSAVGRPAGPAAAVRYDQDRNPMRFYLTDHPGSGDVWASAHDMARFLAFHMGTPLAGQTPILSDEARLAMQRPASAHPMPTPPGAPRRDIGANWIVTSSNGHPQIFHSGGQPGVSTVMAFFPEQKLGFVLLANASAPLGPIGETLRAALAPELLEPESAAAPAPAPRGPIPFEGRWVGTATSYAGEQPIVLTFGEGGAVAVTFADRDATPLAQASFQDGALTGRFRGTSNIPEAARTEHGLSLQLVLADGELTGQLIAQGQSPDTVFMLPSFVRLRRSSSPVE